MVVGVVVLALLVRDAAEAEAREILDREVAIVDDERELVGVGRSPAISHIASAESLNSPRRARITPRR